MFEISLLLKAGQLKISKILIVEYGLLFQICNWPVVVQDIFDPSVYWISLAVNQGPLKVIGHVLGS